ncbi:WD repeat-containing protein 43 [Euwallacea similis]|uniref:WD repeat-containing protein 43 n=1 Tax=Euwallacea similis TaxID=1736056 RepID=UPI00344C72BB
MALQAASFSEDGKYFAQITGDGKLHIWNTLSNSLEQEFTPDFHLTTPCTCLHFWNPRQSSNKGSPSPKKKKRREEVSTSPNIVLGTTSGILLIYSLTKGAIEYTIDSKTNTQVNCVSITSNSLSYSGADQNILEWNLKNKELQSKWKGGNETITSILALPDNKTLLTASKIIKQWQISSREVLRTFTGHSSEIVFMLYVDLPQAGSYVLSGSKGDRLLSCWNLSSDNKQKNAVCNYLMQDSVQYISVNVSDQGLTKVAATNKSGTVHVFQHKLNGKCDKPLKPKSAIQVVSDTGQTNEPVKPLRVFGARFIDSDTVCLGHGSDLILTFEQVEITSKRVEVLIRQDPHALKKSKDVQITKIKKPLIGDGVHYVSTESSKRKPGQQQEIPMEQRLENLTLSKSEGKVPRVDNVAQLLLQGMHSKDRNILRTALFRSDENVIRNSIKRLPVTVFEGLISELSILIHGKTIMSRFGALWLKHLVQVHAGVLISNPSLPELFSSALGSIDNKINSQAALNRLKGKLELLVPQVTSAASAENDEEDEALLVFNDKGSSDSESEEEVALEIDSDSEPENWEEDDVEDGNMEVDRNHMGSSPDSGDSVVMVDDGHESD